MRPFQRFGPVVLILLVAAYLRWMNLGLDPLYADDSVISLNAIGVARHGRLTLVGPVMSVGLWHSPLSMYLYAIPYALSPDPRVARLFTGAVNVIAVALVYVIGARFFCRPAGWIAAMLFSVHTEAVVIGRGIWNPNLGAPFIMLYIATGLMGYYHDQRWARVAHLPALSLGLQCHPAAVLLLPISAVVGLHALRYRARQWKEIVGQTALSGALAMLTLLPWGIGLYLAWQGGGSQTEIDSLPNRGLGYVFTTLYQGLGYWRQHYSQAIMPTLVALGSLWLIVRALRRPDGIPGLVVVLGFFLVPILALALNAKYRGFYLSSSFPNAFLIVGACVGGAARPRPLASPWAKLWNWQGLIHVPVVRWLTPALVSLIVGLNLIYDFTPPESFLGPRHSLDEQIAAINLTRQLAAGTGREALLLANDSGGEPPYAWELLNDGQSSRVIWHGRPLPLPPNGAVMVGFAEDDSWPAVFSGGQRFGRFFRIVEVPPASDFRPDLVPPGPIHLANGTTLVGFLTRPPATFPHANQPWTVYLLWRVDRPSGKDFTIFVHLVNANGDKYAQLDVPGLPAGHQRAGEYALSRLDFQLGDGLPPAGPLYLRVGMYDDAAQFRVLDEAGDSIGDYGLIQIRGRAEALMAWDGFALSDFALNNPLLQGPPLDVKATWHFTQAGQPELHVRWRLLSADGSPAFEQATVLALAPSSYALSSGVFLTQQYSFRIPTDIAAGNYALEITPVDNRNQPVGQSWSSPIEIAARARGFHAPQMEHTTHATFGDHIRLLGYDMQQEGKNVRLVLHWQAIGQIARDYKYFVHVWRDGQVVAQTDSMPDGYRYLTSWWAPDEVFSESVSLDLNPLEAGEYQVTTGFYDPITGERLPVTFNDGVRSPEAWVTLQTIALQ